MKCWCDETNYRCGDCENQEKWETLDSMEKATVRAYAKVLKENAFNPTVPAHRAMLALCEVKKVDPATIPRPELERIFK